jgi:hypothetical protein
MPESYARVGMPSNAGQVTRPLAERVCTAIVKQPSSSWQKSKVGGHRSFHRFTEPPQQEERS